MRVPGRGKQQVGTVRRDGKIGNANLRALVKHFRPMLPAVGGLVDSTVRVGPVRVTKRADVDNICIPRIDNDTADLTGIAQADVFPALAAIGRAIHSVARGQVRANVRFSGADVNDLWVGGSDGNRSNGSDGLMIEDGLPGDAGVRRLPNAAPNRAKIEGSLTAGNSTGRDCPASAKRTDQSPLEAAEKIWRNGLRAQRRKSETKQNQKMRCECRSMGRLHVGSGYCSEWRAAVCGALVSYLKWLPDSGGEFARKRVPGRFCSRL